MGALNDHNQCTEEHYGYDKKKKEKNRGETNVICLHTSVSWLCTQLHCENEKMDSWIQYPFLQRLLPYCHLNKRGILMLQQVDP